MGSTLFWLGYAVCGIVTYGLVKGHARASLESFSPDSETWRPRFSSGYETVCRLVALLGYFGVAISLFIAIGSLLRENIPFRFCFRMPKELCEQAKTQKDGARCSTS